VSVPRMTEGLLEREAELAELADVLERARRAAVGQVLVIEGPGGIGKTRLLQAARERARGDGVRVLFARGSEHERAFPYGVVRQLFEPALFGASDDQRAAWLSGAASLTRPMLTGAATDGEVEDAAYARLHGLYWLCANLTLEGPLLVCVDDAQWSDEPSLAFIAFLARRIEALPLAIALGSRPRAERDSPVLRALVTDPAARLLRPAPLSGAAVSAWVRATVSANAQDAFCHACHNATQGNPFLVGELLHEATAKHMSGTAAEARIVRRLGSDGVSTVVLQRIARLTGGAAAMTRAVALLGEGARVSVATALAELGPAAAEDAIEALCRADVLTRTGDRLGCVHPIVHAAITNDLPARARSEGHARAAQLLAECGAAPEEIGSQLLEVPAGGDPWAVAMLSEAARRAASLGDPEAAAAYLRRALDEPPAPELRASLLIDLARAEAQSGRPEAPDHYRAAMDEATDPAERGRAALWLARTLKFRGRAAEAIGVLREALEHLSDADAELSDELEIELIGCAYIGLEGRLMLGDVIAGLSEPAGPARTPLERTHVAGLAFEEVVRCGSPERVAALARRALEDWDMPTDVSVGGHAYVTATATLWFAERYDEALALFTRAIDDARRRGSGPGFAAGASLRSLLHFRVGNLSDAEADATAALALRHDVQGAQGYLACALNALVFTTLDRGTAGPDQLALCDEFFAMQPSADLPYAQAQEARGWLRASLGDPERGLAELLACGERELRWVDNPTIVAWRTTASHIAHRMGDDERALALAAEEVAVARRWGTPRVLGTALRALALAEGTDRRLALLAEAVAVLARSRAVLELARTRRPRAGARARRPQGGGGRGAARRPSARVRARRRASRRARARRARRARPPAAAVARRARHADAERAARRRDGGRRHEQPRDRPGAVRDREDRRDAPRTRLHQAWGALAPAAAGATR
jgi:tetratricopeptide (TPR) repeat protein